MKKYLYLILIFYPFHLGFSQVILSEDFQNPIPNMYNSLPPGTTYDNNWYHFDLDSLIDGSGEGRPDSWYIGEAFSQADSLIWSGDANFVMTSNSRFSSPGKAQNWIITPSLSGSALMCINVEWNSAPLSAPFKLDGYKVLLSTTTNAIESFTDTVYIAAEYSGPSNMGGDYNLYSFSPANNWIHGWDGTSVIPYELEYFSDSSQAVGIFSKRNFAELVFGPFYLAFVHDSYDDNLISIDDIVIQVCNSIDETELQNKISIFPNPASDFIELKEINSKEGRLVLISTIGAVHSFTYDENTSLIDVSNLANGFYTVLVKDVSGDVFMTKLVLIK